LSEHAIHLALLIFGREGSPLMAWPLHNYDVGRRVGELVVESDGWCGHECVFLIKKWVKSKEDLGEVLSKADIIDGIIIYILTTSIDYNLLYEAVRKLGKPTLVLTEPYHSLAWPEITELMREGHRLIGVSSSSSEDRLKGVRALRTYIMLRKRVRTLVVTTPDEMSLESLHRSEIYSGDRIYSGTYFSRLKEFLDPVFVGYDELIKTYNLTRNEDAVTLADEILRGSYWIRDHVSKEDIVKATKIYLALKELLRRYGAEALAVNCFTIMLKDLNALPVTPCIAVSLLNDEGIPSACEADLNSLILQVIFKYLAGRPAWISDPVIDFKDDSVVYAHCTAPTKMKGFEEEAEPYAIDTHDESGKPAVIRTRMRVGQVITVAQISSDFTKMYVHTNKVSDVPIVDLACRTKIKITSRKAREWMWNYNPPLHRVIAYGNWANELVMISKFMGLEVIRELD